MSVKTDCSRCALYAELRGYRILAEIRKTTTVEKQVNDRWVEFLGKYHGLHMSADADGIEMRQAIGRYVALMALVTEEEPGAVEVQKVNGSDARPGPPPGRPSASRSARPSGDRNGRRHGGRGQGGEPSPNSRQTRKPQPKKKD